MKPITFIAIFFSTCLVLSTPYVQADSLQDLLVAKGILPAAQAAQSTDPKVYWNNGTRIEFPENGFSTQISTFLQSRYTYLDADEHSSSRDTSSFDQNKVRLLVQGTAVNNEFSYNLVTDFAGHKSEDGEKTPTLLDAAIGWRACDNATFYLGQWKTGISRQHLNSDHTLQMVNRSLVSDYFNLGRQAGARVDLRTAEGDFKATAGIYNGESADEGLNRAGVDTQHTAVLNLRWNAVGEMNTGSEGDIDWSDELQLSFGTAYARSEGELEDSDLSADRINVDANLKYRGLAVHTEYYVLNQESQDSDNPKPQGFYFQTGYFVIPKKLELAAQYGLLDCDDGAGTGVCTDQERFQHIQGGLNYYFWKHNLKVQVGYDRRLQSPVRGEDIDTDRWLLQVTAYI